MERRILFGLSVVLSPFARLFEPFLRQIRVALHRHTPGLTTFLLLTVVLSACGLSQPGSYAVMGVSTLTRPADDTVLAPSNQAGIPRVIMPKWLTVPELDGDCSDTVYADAGALPVIISDPQGVNSAQGTLLHTTLDAFVCVTNLPPGFTSLAVRIDADHSRSEVLDPGDYEFHMTRAGATAVARGFAGGFEPIEVPATDFDGAILPASGSRWVAELRISLEWFGGYARLDGLSLEVVHTDGDALRWPPAATSLSPATWGDVEIAPRYPDPIEAGSAFVDGREGYLSVPYSPALNPPAITIEAWLKVVDGDCGTLVGNGQSTSYWLALCEVLAFGYAGPDTVRTGQNQPGEGWHHVAITMESLIEGEGVRTLYIDGVVDTRPGWEPSEEEPNGTPRPRPRLEPSDRMVRFGADRDVPGAQGALHGYIRDLRIWNYVRSADEIRDNAFQQLSGREPGLVGLWPFRDGLQDLVAGHDAGLIGNASLASEQPDVTRFPPPPPPPEPMPDPEPLVLPPWDARIPIVPGPINIDGICGPDEWAGATRMRLEPNRALSLDMKLDAEALYLCMHPLFGQLAPGNRVTLLFNRDGKARAAPGPGDLRLQLTPDGAVVAQTGNGQTWANPAPGLIDSKVISGTTWNFQEDLIPILAPWWSMELKLPLSMLAPFQIDDTLRLGARYEASLPSPLPPGLPWDELLQGQWPPQFDESVPESWGQANEPQASIFLPLVRNSGQAGPPITAMLGSQAVPQSHQAPPTAAHFNAACPGWAAPAYAFDSQAKWPQVDRTGHGAVWAEGTLSEIYVSSEDSPWIHSSHDVDMKITVAPNSRWLVLDGGSSLVLETESIGFPPEHRPLPNDHVTVMGRWIFDCGHEPKTEVHPTPYFASDRLETRPVHPGKPMQEVRVARVWMNSSPGAFGRTLYGPFTFTMRMPSTTGRHPFLTVVRGDPSRVQVAFNGTVATVTVTPPAEQGRFDWELVLGNTNSSFTRPGYAGYVVHLDSIDVRNDHDDGFPDCGSFPDYQDCGEWSMTANINGVGRQLLWNARVEEDDDPRALGVQFPVVGGDLQLTVEGYDDDDPVKGDVVSSGTWTLGALGALCCNKPLSHTTADWTLAYHVTAGATIPLSLPDPAFWSARLADESNDDPDFATKIRLDVPPGGPVALTTRTAYLSERGLDYAGVRLLGRDVDHYDITMNDLATLTVSGLPANLRSTIESYDPWYGQLPANIVALTGYLGARVKVDSADGAAGDARYDLRLGRSAKVLPPDWGENADQTVDGRLIDLATPAPQTVVVEETLLRTHTRSQKLDWAWQHVSGDVDRYTITFLPVHPPLNQGRTPCDDLPALKLRAPGARISIPSLNLAADHELILTDLNNQFPTLRAAVEVRALPGQIRGVYQFSAQWNDGKYFSTRACDAFTGNIFAGGRKGILSELFPPGYGPDLPYPQPYMKHLRITNLGVFNPTRLEYGKSLDALISSPATQPLVARLYTQNGVLLAESSRVSDIGVRSLAVAPGLAPQSRIAAANLQAGTTYLMQLLPATSIGAPQQVPVGIGAIRSAQPEPSGPVVGTGTPESCTEAALDAALAGGGDITFDCGGPFTFALTSQKVIRVTTHLHGNDLIKLSGGDAVSIFKVEVDVDLTLDDLLLTDGFAVRQGGAIDNYGRLNLHNTTVQRSSLSLEGQDCQFGSVCGGAGIFNHAAAVLQLHDSSVLSNTGGFYGGGIYNAGRLVVTNSDIRYNQSQGSGGGIESDGVAEISNATISDNQAIEAFGGGLAVFTGTLTMVNTSVERNRAGRLGGGLIISSYGSGPGDPVSDTTVEIRNAEISDNTAGSAPDHHGGGLYVTGGARVELASVTVSRNSAGGNGGGLYSFQQDTNVQISEATFEGNRALGSGGGIENQGQMVLVSSTVMSNTLIGDFTAPCIDTDLCGGAGVSNIDGTLELRETTIVDNDTRTFGGGIASNRGTLRLDNSLIQRNRSDSSGAGLYIRSPTTIDNTSIIGNQAGSSGDGGGMFVIEGPVTIRNSAIENNTTLFGGGGIAISSPASGTPGVVTIEDSRISGNQAVNTLFERTNRGGGIFNYGGVLSLSRVTVADNQADNGGGLASELDTADVRVSQSTFSGNLASGDPTTSLGGAIYIDAGRALLENVTLSGNTALERGGGIEAGNGQAEIRWTTIFGNRAPVAANLGRNDASLSMYNTIVAGPRDGPNCNQLSLQGGDHNLADDESCDLRDSSDLQGIDPLLGDLADNGGPTLTHLPQVDSPVLEAGSDACPTVDQRGYSRPAGAACDIGAVELGALAPSNLTRVARQRTGFQDG